MKVSKNQWIEYLVQRDAHNDSEAKQIAIYANQCWRDLELLGVVLVDLKQLSDKLKIVQEMWDTAKATSDDRILSSKEKEILENYEYVGNTLAFATGQMRLLKELLEG